MAKVGKGPNLNQGEGGARKKGSSGDHLNDQGPTGAFKKGPSGSHLDQGPNGRTRKSGSHLDQHPSNVRGKQAPQRGGHSREGYGNNEKTSKSGSKFAQNPGFYK